MSQRGQDKMGVDPCRSVARFRSVFRKRLAPQTAKAIVKEERAFPQGRPAGLSVYQLIMALVYHVLQGCGKLAANTEAPTGKRFSDSTLSKRRQNLPWQAVERIAGVFLGPRARPEQHPEAFYKGMRLVGIDGSKFSVCNLPALTTTLEKAISRRLKAAFAKIGVVTLVELGLHNPIAVKVGVNAESEAALAKQLLAQLEDCLYLADRLYGNACVVALSLAQKAVSRVQFLLRVSGRPKPRLIEILKDGSALVEIKHGSEKMIVREIRGRLRKRGGNWTTVRLWTSLLDASRYPGRELLELYGQRWEHEITYKELKGELRDSVLLNAHTVETARQEIVALVMAQSMVSELRELVAEIAQIPVLEISFPQDTAHGACPVVCAGAG